MILVVDDSPIDRHLAGSLLARQESYRVVFAENGAEALEVLQRCQPDLIVTDLQMPELDGLQLVEAVRRSWPSIPTILMTGHGSEEIACRALKQGAASYVTKRTLANDLFDTVREVLAIAHSSRLKMRLGAFWQASEFHFRLDNDTALISPLVQYLQQATESLIGADETETLQLGVALQEALRNAMHHGNLELNSELRRQSSETYYSEAMRRRQLAPYRGRMVHVRFRETPSMAEYTIRDEGPGFDPSAVADPLDPANLSKPSGRGLFLIRTFMAEVRFNSQGNEITMVHQRSPRGIEAANDGRSNPPRLSSLPAGELAGS